MRRSVAAVAGVGPSVARTDRGRSTDPESAPRTDRSLSDERAATARDYDEAIAVSGVAGIRLAQGFLGVGESVVRRLRSGEKPLGLHHLALGPVDVWRAVLTRSVVRALGKSAAIGFFADCLSAVSRGE